MQRAGRLLRRLKLPADCEISNEDLVRAAWPQAVGPQIARNSRIVGLKGTRLIVEVADPLFRQNLELFSRPILGNLARIAGPDLVDSITVRLGVERIEPRKAAAARPADEADGIHDPVLRRIYKTSRERISS